MIEVAELLNTALAGRYRVERELGRGGMATVFLAEDLRHRRRVAIKVLTPELTTLLGPERFLREIEIASRLQHPHILTLLDSGEAGGLLYYVMPYVAGESLRQRLGRERQLPVEDALRLAREVAGALDYAHRQGVIHRDIKPENILLVDGHAVVADFGIARAIGVAGGAKLTGTGDVLGTPAYMSPEQVLGGADLDGRSDVYSLACVLYEMLAGTPPFAGATGETLAHQHLSVEPRLVTSVRTAVPEATARSLARALAKTPADRFATAAQFGDALAPTAAAPFHEALAPTTEIGKPKAASPANRRSRVIAIAAAALIALTVAVWRFGPSLLRGRPPDPAKKAWVLVADFDGPKADSTVVAATRDLVIAVLEQSEIVAAVPRDQIRLALETAGKPASTRVDSEMARELPYRSSVRTVLEGRVGRLGSGYSLILRLVDADSARVVLSLGDAAKSEENLIPMVGRIARRLRAGLGERRSALQETRDLALAATPSFEAYKTLVRARRLLLANENRSAITLFRSALTYDADFASAYGGLGWAFSNLEEPDSALAAFRAAYTHRARFSESQRLFCETSIAFLSGDLAGALDASERHTLIDPQSWAVHSNRSLYLNSAGQPIEALESTRIAETVSPIGPNQQVLGNELYCLLVLGRVDEARRLVPRLKGGYAIARPMQIASVAGEWPAAESLAFMVRGNSAANGLDRTEAGAIIASAQASRGQAKEADQTLLAVQSDAEAAGETVAAHRARWRRLMLALFSRGVAVQPPDPGRWDSTTVGLVTRGQWATAAGETTLARRLLATVRTRSSADIARQGFTPLVLQAWIAARGGRWEDVVRDLGPAARQGDARGYVLLQSAPLVRWLVAEAYERLNRPDSAAVYFERAIAAPAADWLSLENVPNGRLAVSFGHRRLALLYARMGRLEEARRHGEMFAALFTRPDLGMAPLIAEVRAAIAGAEGMAKASRR